MDTLNIVTVPAISAEAFEFYREFIESWAKYKGGAYLEIGCFNGGLTARIAKLDAVKSAIGIDINGYSDWLDYARQYPKVSFMQIASDEFFDNLFFGAAPPPKYDMIFIDADHSKEQVGRDIENALKHLTVEGIILVHDTLPPSDDYKTPALCGDGYLAIESLREQAWIRELQIFTIPVVYGLTLISKLPHVR